MEGAREGSAKVRQERSGRGIHQETLERGLPRFATGRKDFHQAGPRRTEKGKKISTKGHEGRHEGALRRWRGLKRGSPGVGKGPSKAGRKGKKNSTKGHEGVGGDSRGVRQGVGEGIHQETLRGVWKDSGRGPLRKTGRKGKKISTKGHEERRRATKALEETQEGFAKVHHGEKRFPPSGSTKDGKRQKDFHEGARRTAKGH